MKMSNVAYQIREKQEYRKQRLNKTSTVIVEKGRISKGEAFLLTLLAFLFFVASVFIVYNYASIQTLNRDIHVLQTEIDNKTRINEDLELQVTELSEPDRILKIAKELGLTLNENNVKVISN